MSTICFYAQFIASKIGADGLTVTWDVEQVTRSDGTRSALVTGGATTITVGRRGLYGYRLASADLSLYDYVATAITATTTVDQQEIAAIGMVMPDALVSDIETDTQDIQNRLPGVLVNGRIIADTTAIGNSQAAADAIKAMLTGVGGTVLSLAGLDVVADSAAPAVTISNAGTGSAIKLQTQSGHTILIEQIADTSSCAIRMISHGTGVWIEATNDNGIEITTDGVNAVGVMINSENIAALLSSAIGEAVHISTNANNKPAVYVQHYGTNPGPAVKLESTISAGLEVKGAAGGPDILLSGSGILSAILTALGVDAITAAAIAADAGVELAGAVRTELTTELAHLDADVSTAGGGIGLTPQETADAVHNLAPVGVPAVGSVGGKLNLIDTNVDAIKAITDSLDRSSLTVVTQNNVGAITIISTTNLAATISGLTVPAGWLRMYWTVKRSLLDLDVDSIIQIVVTNGADAGDGLIVLNGAAVLDATPGSLTVNQPAGSIAIALTAGATALLPEATDLVWDCKYHLDDLDEEKTQAGVGTATIALAVTRT